MNRIWCSWKGEKIGRRNDERKNMSKSFADFNFSILNWKNVKSWKSLERENLKHERLKTYQIRWCQNAYYKLRDFWMTHWADEVFCPTLRIWKDLFEQRFEEKRSWVQRVLVWSATDHRVPVWDCHWLPIKSITKKWVVIVAQLPEWSFPATVIGEFYKEHLFTSSQLYWKDEN